MTNLICRAFLTASRKVAKSRSGWTDVGCGVTSFGSKGNRYYVVEGASGSGIQWEGKACCSYCARVEAIMKHVK